MLRATLIHMKAEHLTCRDWYAIQKEGQAPKYELEERQKLWHIISEKQEAERKVPVTTVGPLLSDCWEKHGYAPQGELTVMFLLLFALVAAG